MNPAGDTQRSREGLVKHLLLERDALQEEVEMLRRARDNWRVASAEQARSADWLRAEFNVARADLGKALAELDKFHEERDAPPPAPRRSRLKRILDGVSDVFVMSPAPRSAPVSPLGLASERVSRAVFGPK